MKNTLDLRQSNAVRFNQFRSDSSYLAAWLVALAMFASGFLYMHWLDAGCALNGVMTWHGKACIK